MKKIYFMGILLIYFLLPTDIFAAMSASMTCPTGGAPGQTIACTVSGISSPELLSGLEASIGLSSNLEFVSIVNAAGWNGESSPSKLVVFRNTGITGTVPLATINLKIGASATGTASITLSSIFASDSDGGLQSSANIVKNIKVYSTNNNLATLTFDGTSVSGFTAGTTTYNVGTVNKATVTVGGTLADSFAYFASGFGPRTVNLNYGANAIQIKAVSESGATKVYTINVTRSDNRSGNNSLKSLSISGGTINFTASTTTYNVTVDATSTAISAAVENGTATFASGFGPRTVNLNYGKNVIEVKVVAENQAVKTYTINITRTDPRNADNTLKELKLDKGTVAFYPNVLSYNVSVEYNVTEVKVTAAPTSNKSKVEIIGGKNLEVGKNTITIKVTAENEIVNTYTINVIRLNEGEKLPTTNLSNIDIKGYKIPFNSEKTEYTLKIKNEDKLDLDVIPEDPGSLIKVYGNEELKNGSKIFIVVISRDGNIKESVINIEKSEIPIYIFITALGTFIITSIIWMVFGKKKYKLPKEEVMNKVESNPIETTTKLEVINNADEPKAKFFDETVVEYNNKTINEEVTNNVVREEPAPSNEDTSKAGKICPNCKMVNPIASKICFFCKTELKK